MKETSKVYSLGKRAGLNKGEIDAVLKEMVNKKEQTNFSAGYACYPGGYYGSISVKDF